MLRLSMLTVYFTLMLAAISNARSSWGRAATVTVGNYPVIVLIGVAAIGLFTFVAYKRSGTE